MKALIAVMAFAASIITADILHAQGYDITYQDGSSSLKGYYSKPRGKGVKNVPGIVVLPAWMGITAHEKQTVARLGEYGYHALAADIYGSGIRPSNAQEAGTLSGRYKKDYKAYQARIQAAIHTLIKQGADAANIIVIGYCFGGTGAIEAARGGLPVKGVVSFHGGLGKDSTRTNNTIQCPVLVLHGADDPYVSEKEIRGFQQEMRAAKADWQMIYFANAVHAFTEPAAGNDNSKGAAYNRLADERSWQYLLQFIKQVLSP